MHQQLNLVKPKGHVMHQQFNHWKPTGYVMHLEVLPSTTVDSTHTVFMCFVFIWEQTAICATYSDLCLLYPKLIGFYNLDEKCLLRGTNWIFK